MNVFLHLFHKLQLPTLPLLILHELLSCQGTLLYLSGSLLLSITLSDEFLFILMIVTQGSNNFIQSTVTLLCIQIHVQPGT